MINPTHLCLGFTNWLIFPFQTKSAPVMRVSGVCVLRFFVVPWRDTFTQRHKICEPHLIQSNTIKDPQQASSLHNCSRKTI
jgi:hypothetical protein